LTVSLNDFHEGLVRNMRRKTKLMKEFEPVRIKLRGKKPSRKLGTLELAR